MKEVPSPAITASGLRKSYGKKLVLDDIDLDVPAGRVWSLLGPNGAGKTTMVHILSTLICPDAGTIYIDGHDLAKEADAVRRVIGVTGQFAAVDDMLTGEENLLLMGDLLHLDRRVNRQRAADLLRRFELADDAKRRASTYSGGMRRKLDLAMTLVGTPKIIFLDEPTAGLDPRSRHTMWAIIRAMVADGITIFLTTQYLDEVDELADRVAVLDHGKLVAEGTPAELKRLVPGGHILLTFGSLTALESGAQEIAGSISDGDALELRVPSDGELRSVRGLLDRLALIGAEPVSLSVRMPDLDDVFLTLTGRPTAEIEQEQAEQGKRTQPPVTGPRTTGPPTVEEYCDEAAPAKEAVR